MRVVSTSKEGRAVEGLQKWCSNTCRVQAAPETRVFTSLRRKALGLHRSRFRPIGTPGRSMQCHESRACSWLPREALPTNVTAAFHFVWCSQGMKLCHNLQWCRHAQVCQLPDLQRWNCGASTGHTRV
jgi:hypothetical protein